MLCSVLLALVCVALGVFTTPAATFYGVNVCLSTVGIEYVQPPSLRLNAG